MVAMSGSYKPKPLTAHQLFKIGHGTDSISSILGITEAEALEQVSSQRSAMLGLPDPHTERRSNRVYVRDTLSQSSGGG